MNVKDIKPSEYDSFYQTYIEACGKNELLVELKNSLEDTTSFFKSIPINKIEYRYEPGKWTIKELIQHLIDSERILVYRALRFARNDKTELMGYDHDNYVPKSKANGRGYSDLIEEFKTVRQSSIHLYRSFTEDMLLASGIANNNSISVRAIGFVVVGHCNHHVEVIKKRYL